MSRRSITVFPSETARGVAYLRAIGSREANQDFKCEDYLADIFLESDELQALKYFQFDSMIRYWVENHALPGAYEYLVARTKFFDSMVIDSIKQGFEQVVILGAGYDTRALRLSDNGSQCFFIEIDAQNTQRRKCALLQKAGIHEEMYPEMLEIDFNTQSLADVLSRSRRLRQKKTLFLWEGVTMYLSEDSVAEVLNAIKMFGNRNKLLFDYVYKEVINGDLSYYGAKESVEYVTDKGEPYTFGVPSGQVKNFLSKFGYELEFELSPERLQEMYLTDKSGMQLGRPYGFFAVVCAHTWSSLK